MAYKNIHDGFWTDPDVKKLEPTARYLFLYFITNPHSHLSGLYYIPKSAILEETGLPENSISGAMTLLISNKFIAFDHTFSVVFVKNMLKYQPKSSKVLKSVATHLGGLHRCPLIKDFLKRYNTLSIPYQYPINTHTEGYPTGETGNKKIEDRDTCAYIPYTVSESGQTETETETEKNIYMLVFDDLWKNYPNKDGKKAAKKYFIASVKTDNDIESIKRADKNYKKHLQLNQWKQPKNGSTWFNNWRDWVDWKEPDIKTEAQVREIVAQLGKEAESKPSKTTERVIEKLKSGQWGLENYNVYLDLQNNARLQKAGGENEELKITLQKIREMLVEDN